MKICREYCDGDGKEAYYWDMEEQSYCGKEFKNN